MRIHSDSSATLRGRVSNICKSKLVYECHLALERITIEN